jgi:hypothetical protein
MSEAQFFQNEIMHINNENKQEENKITSLNGQYKELDRNNPLNNEEKDEDLKIGQYMLTPLQSIIINKKMPFGFKLETEENILKSLETTKSQAKKSKNSTRHKEKGGRDHRNGGIMQNKKRNQNMNNIDNIPSHITLEVYKIYKKCRKGLDKIKESKYANNYYQSNNPDVPCLANIEKKVNNYEYKSIYDFEMDVRRIWNYYFKLEQNNEITLKMSDDWEKICADLDNPNTEMSMASVRKRTEQIQKELEEMKDNNLTKESVPAPVKKVNQNYEQNKPMTVEEKNQLGNNIRSLNKEQLKGIIKILSENNPIPQSKYFEFDIDKLSTKKLRELEKYVKDCLASNNKNNKNIPSISTQIQSSNNNTQNQKENQNNKSNNKGINNQNQPTLKSNNKDVNKNQENKVDQSAKKIKQSNKKPDKKNESSSESDSISSGSSLSN